MVAARVCPNAGGNPKGWRRMTDTTRKTCPRCGQSKPLTEYYAHKWRADGRADVCRECSKAASRARKAAKRAAGLCVDCGAPSAGKRFCPACTAKRKYMATGAKPVVPSLTGKTCPRCGQSKTLADFYARPWGMATICKACDIARLEAARKRRRAAGLCKCGRPVAPGRGRCDACLERRRTRYAQRRNI